MAKIQIEYDTVEKTCSLLQDAKELSNVKSFSLYHDGGKTKEGKPTFMMDCSMSEKDDDNDMITYTGLRANLVEQIAKYLSNERS